MERQQLTLALFFLLLDYHTKIHALLPVNLVWRLGVAGLDDPSNGIRLVEESLAEDRVRKERIRREVERELEASWFTVEILEADID